MSSFQCFRCGQWVGSLQVHEVGNGCCPPSYTTNATNTIPPLPILPAPIEQPPEGFDPVTSLTLAMREADEAFKQVGGGTRHHVRECLLPSMEKHGIAILPATELADLRARVAELEQQVAASSMCSEDAKAAQRTLMGETFPEAILRLEKQVAALANGLEMLRNEDNCWCDGPEKDRRGETDMTTHYGYCSEIRNALRAAGRKT